MHGEQVLLGEACALEVCRLGGCATGCDKIAADVHPHTSHAQLVVGFQCGGEFPMKRALHALAPAPVFGARPLVAQVVDVRVVETHVELARWGWLCATRRFCGSGSMLGLQGAPRARPSQA